LLFLVNGNGKLDLIMIVCGIKHWQIDMVVAMKLLEREELIDPYGGEVTELDVRFFGSLDTFSVKEAYNKIMSGLHSESDPT
jgi:hypothetical protein